MPIGLLINLVLSFIGIFLGISASIVFHIYGNSWAVFWAFLSACLALLNFHLHYLKYRGTLEEWHSDITMSTIKALGFVMTIPIIALLGWFTFRIYYDHLPTYPIQESLVITSVWTFMAGKWSFMLFLTGRKYEKYLKEVNTPLLPATRS